MHNENILVEIHNDAAHLLEVDTASEYFLPLSIHRKIKHLCYNSKIPKENYVS
jgi:hypothetical protein